MSYYHTINASRLNFVEQSNDFIRRVPDASFIAIDEEMTGITLPPSEATPLSKDDSPEHRYISMKQIPERYSIIQLGITLFFDETKNNNNGSSGGMLLERKYKFTMFPSADQHLTREVTLHPSAIHFLQEHNMSFDTWVKYGIPFCNEASAENVTERFIQKYQNRMKPAAVIPPNNRQRLVLTRDSDKQFHARCITRLREWLDAPLANPAPAHGEGVSLLLPRCNSYLRRSLYEAIQRDYPYLVVETENEQIRVLRMTEEEKAVRNQRLLYEDYQQFVTEKIGVYRIFLALHKACQGGSIDHWFEQTILSPNPAAAVADFVPGQLFSRKKIPLIVHNGLMDLLFLFTNLNFPKLPTNWVDCKDLIHQHFPIIFDTKVLASEYCNGYSSRTHLEALYNETLGKFPEWRRMDGSQGLLEDEQAHDAAYDAYMTGVSFQGLIQTIHNQSRIPPSPDGSKFRVWELSDQMDFPRWLYGRNKLYFHLSPYTIDLESACDPLGKRISELSTYRVSKIDAQVSTRDILDCVRGLTDTNHQPVNIEIFWVDDTTFLIGARITALQQDPGRFKEHGQILCRALKGRFCNGEKIELFVSPNGTGYTKSIWNLWGLVGPNNNSQDRRSKKRRLH